MLLGIDIGTSGTKVLLLDTDGRVLAKTMIEYPLFTPKPLWSEQDPHHWWEATVAGIREILSTDGVNPKTISAVGLTGQMHGLVPIDASGIPVRHCILWNDQRTSKECDAITEIIGRAELIRITGKPVLPSFTLPKILWMRYNERDKYDKVAHILLPKDYIRYRLTGTLLSDVSDASGTSLIDVGRRKWSEEILRELRIPKNWLPDVTESSIVTSTISSYAARITGLLAGTPVIAGAGDQAAEAVGCGIVEEGSVSVTIGTSGVVFAAMNECLTDPDGRIHTYCHALPNMWHCMGVMLSAGGSLRWFRDVFCGEEKRDAYDRKIDTYEILSEQASSVEPGSDGLLFLPYLSGERTPHADPYARGVFFGVTLRHQREHFIRSVMEGVAFGLKDSIVLMNDMKLQMNNMRLSGGGARSGIWGQIIADVLGSTVHTVKVTEGAAYGAALLAGVGIGAYNTVREATESIVQDTSTTIPSQSVTKYERLYPRYQELYRKLRDEFKYLHEAL